MLTSRVLEHTEKITHYNQVGFIPERQSCFNIHESVNGIHQINKLKDRNHIISVDAENPFDKVFDKSPGECRNRWKIHHNDKGYIQ